LPSRWKGPIYGRFDTDLSEVNVDLSEIKGFEKGVRRIQWRESRLRYLAKLLRKADERRLFQGVGSYYDQSPYIDAGPQPLMFCALGAAYIVANGLPAEVPRQDLVHRWVLSTLGNAIRNIVIDLNDRKRFSYTDIADKLEDRI
jgi:hypothetical protein